MALLGSEPDVGSGREQRTLLEGIEPSLVDPKATFGRDVREV
jgi:hypothetical protein